MQQVLHLRFPDYLRACAGEVISQSRLLTGACDGKIQSSGLVRLLSR